MKSVIRNSDFFITVGGIFNLIKNFIVLLIRKKTNYKEMFFHCYELGALSLGLIALTGFIIGLVLTLQSRPTLADFGATALLPAMVSVSVIREIGPVVTSLICAGKIGSRIGAEISSMRVTEQIDALEVSAINPISYLVIPRILATTFMIPLLVVYSDIFSLFGSYVGYNITDAVSIKIFIKSVTSHIDFSDVIPAIIKTIIFGFFIGVIACYYGFYTEGGTQSVGKAANSSVVASSLAVFIIDMVVVQITSVL
jgi:phospholipid/cholesterol/gamma-HCH transport system permease protein